MNRIRSEKISVKLDRRGVPIEFTRNGAVYKNIKICECRRVTGAWWDGEAEKTYFRAQTAGGGIYDLCLDHGSGTWTISIIQD